MKIIYPAVLLLIFVYLGCKNKDEEINLGSESHHYSDQNSENFDFPVKMKDKNYILSFVFANCPDICPLTTLNIHLIQKRLFEKGIKDFEFVTISFDPNRDTPEILNQYIKDRGYNVSNWHYLTGNKTGVNSLMKKLEYFAIPTDTTITSDKDTLYYFMHTDKIFLISKDQKVLKSYDGSKLNIEEICSDIKKL